jgi:hypothetical protein
VLEAVVAEASTPVGLDLRNHSTPAADRLPSGVGEADEFGAAVSGVRPSLEVAEPLEVVDELGH